MKSIKEKRAAIELSMTTIVIVVLSLTLLIMGFVLIRNIMCSAVGLTKDINKGIKEEINKLFGSTSGTEIQCIGEGSEPVTIIPGKTNYINCGIKASQNAEYSFSVELDERNSEIIQNNLVSSSEVEKWLIGNYKSEIKVSPNDQVAYHKILRITPPKDAPEGDLVYNVVIKKSTGGEFSKQLDFRISRQGVISSAIC